MNNNAISQIVGSILLIGIAISAFGVLYFFSLDRLDAYGSIIAPDNVHAEIYGSISKDGQIYIEHFGGSNIGEWIVKINNETTQGYDFVIGEQLVFDVNTSHENQVDMISKGQLIFSYKFPPINPIEPPVETIECFQCQNYTLVNQTFNGTSCPPEWFETAPECEEPPPEPLEVVLQISDIVLEYNYYLINASTSLEALKDEDNKTVTHNDGTDTAYWRFGFNDTSVTNITNVTMCIYAEQVFDAGQITSYISYGWNPMEMYVGSYGCYEVVYDVNPTTGVNWTTAEVNNLQGQVASGRDNKNCIINCVNIRVTYE